tara:strand:+ start:246 stop:743 length:498 start_codon:yes stop_codon:yes gene_type:complete
MIHALLSRIGIETWKDIPNFKNYQVSNLGNVRSLNYRQTGKTKVLKKSINSAGRYTVTLYRGSQNIGSLVAWAFLKHKPNGHKIVVDHINNIPTNDKLYNLQLITQRKNTTKDRKNKHGYTGISKIGKYFQARIRIKGQKKYLGNYKTAKEASLAYQDALKNIVG